MRGDSLLECDWIDLPSGEVKCSRCDTIRPARIRRRCGDIEIPKPPTRNQTRKGLGTFIAKLIHVFYKQPQCIPCQHREAILNRVGNAIMNFPKNFWRRLFPITKSQRRAKLLKCQTKPIELTQIQIDQKNAKDLRRQALLDHYASTPPQTN